LYLRSVKHTTHLAISVTFWDNHIAIKRSYCPMV
jgi:hypothetical protein